MRFSTFFFLVFFLFFFFGCDQKQKSLEILSTSSENVFVLKDSFAVLNKNDSAVYRKIWLYLPPDYKTSQKHYPVLYMHDGQNLFDDKTSFVGEWKVDETLNELFRETNRSFIVVGIENTGKERLNEYSPWVHSKYGGGSGNRYINMIVNELKPKIDNGFRTKPDPKNTVILGSSMGGLISFYAGLKRPDIFGKIGALSTSFWFSDEVKEFTKKHGALTQSKLFLLVGGKEGGNMDTDMLEMENLLKESGFNSKNLISKLVPEAQHNEIFWSHEFKEVVTWLFEIDYESKNH